MADDAKAKCVLAREPQSSALPVNTDVTTLPYSSGCASSDRRTASLKAKAFNAVTDLVYFVGSVSCTTNKSWKVLFEDFHNRLQNNNTLVLTRSGGARGREVYQPFFKNTILLQLPTDFKIKRHHASKGSLACTVTENRKYN